MLYEFHMLKNYPPTNLNRDDTGAAKTCVFGGIPRGRISSQCLKKSWRDSAEFRKNIGGEKYFGTRSKRLPDTVYNEVCNKLIEEHVEEEVAKKEAEYILPIISGLANKKGTPNKDDIHQTSQIIFFSDYEVASIARDAKMQIDLKKKLIGIGAKEKDVNEYFPNGAYIQGIENGSMTSQIVYLSQEHIDTIAEKIKQILDGKKDKKDKEENVNKIKKIIGDEMKEVKKSESEDGKWYPPVDMALFGRMVTSNVLKNVNASIQVAHAISTNKVVLESDYFTATDDLLNGDTMEESGAAFIEATDYNSSCYYIYASLDSDALKRNLGDVDNADDIVKKTITALLRAMAFTNPSGKQHSFAGNVLPSAILVDCKEDKIPTSMVNAFTKPVRSDNERDLVENSIINLVEEANMIPRDYCLPVKKRLWFCVDKYLDSSKNFKPEEATYLEDVTVWTTIGDMINELEGKKKKA